MAATQQGKIHLSLMDDVGVRASVEFFLMIDPTKTVAQLITDVNTFGLTVLPLVDGGWVRWEIGILPVLPTGALSTPTVDSDAERLADSHTHRPGPATCTLSRCRHSLTVSSLAARLTRAIPT